jgi:hypothetical protein
MKQRTDGVKQRVDDARKHAHTQLINARANTPEINLRTQTSKRTDDAGQHTADRRTGTQARSKRPMHNNTQRVATGTQARNALTTQDNTQRLDALTRARRHAANRRRKTTRNASPQARNASTTQDNPQRISARTQPRNR